MKRMPPAFALTVLIALTVSACENPMAPAVEDVLAMRSTTETAAKANVDHFRMMFELPLTLGIPCIDEEVVIGDGIRHLLVHQVQNYNGYLFRVHLNHNRITGIGSVTGNEYVGQLVLNQHEVSFTEKGQTQTFQLHIHGVSKGSSPNFFITALVHLTLNADGELTAETEFFEAECRG